MSDNINNEGTNYEFVRGQCRVAYTINNAQPVICTIIGDQPLFYMDFDVGYEDEMEMLDSAEYSILEQEVGTLQKELKNLDRFSQPQNNSLDKLESIFKNAAFMCATEKTPQFGTIEFLRARLGKSRLAAAYLEFADQHKIKIEHNGAIETSFYDRNSGKILINPALNNADQQLLAVQELRRHWQHRQGVLIHPLMFHPDNAILVNRAQIADLVVSMVRVAWELQLSGDKETWERIENSSLADLGRAFAREAFLDFRTINNGQAAAAVFECWFLSERCRTQDKLIINQMLADYQGYVFEMEHAVKNITPTLISGLGEMPFGKNYLAEHAVTIMDDVIFSDVRDRSNANFLWFIKFERSFRESEQELQSTSDPSAKDARSKAQSLQDQNHETQAQVIQLFSAHEHAPVERNTDAGPLFSRIVPDKDSKKSNIVYLRRWSGE